MELAEISLFYKKKIWRIVLGSLLFLIAFVGIYFLPAKHVALGSFVVVRTIEPSAEEFSYEGHYAQLTAQDFSRTLATFFENENILQEISEQLHLDQRKLKKRVKVVKESPSVFRLEVRYGSSEGAESIWKMLRDRVFDLVTKINQEADSGLEVFVIGEEPVLRETYKNIYVYGFVGFLTGFLFFSFYFAMKEYLK